MKSCFSFQGSHLFLFLPQTELQSEGNLISMSMAAFCKASVNRRRFRRYSTPLSFHSAFSHYPSTSFKGGSFGWNDNGSALQHNNSFSSKVSHIPTCLHESTWKCLLQTSAQMHQMSKQNIIHHSFYCKEFHLWRKTCLIDSSQKSWGQKCYNNVHISWR